MLKAVRFAICLPIVLFCPSLLQNTTQVWQFRHRMNILAEKRFQEITGKFSTLSPILVVGDVGIDKYTFGRVGRISPEAPVPVLEVEREWEKLGLAANISHNLKSVGVESTLCGVVGGDDKGERLEGLLEANGLKTWGLVCDLSRPTTSKQRITTAGQQICRIDYEDIDAINEGIAGKLEERIESLAQGSGAIIIEDYSKGVASQYLVRSIIDNYASNYLVAVDPGKNTPPMWYRGATLLKPNLVEAKLMVDALGSSHRGKDISELANILVEKLGLEKLVITLGPEGVAMLDTEAGGNVEIIPTVADEVFDVSGAGDTSIALLTASLAAGSSLEEAAWIGNCGAGIVVAKKGTAVVDLHELSSFYYRLLESYQ